jgi:flagella basal body P-ring formation protein FlgA
MLNRNLSNSRRLLNLLLVSASMYGGLSATLPVSAETTSRERTKTEFELGDKIQQTLLEQAMQQYPEDEVTVEVLPVSALVRDKPCNEPVIATTGQPLMGRVSAHIKCADPQAWAFYVSAQLTVRTMIVVPARNILRGELITANMLEREQLDRARLRVGYIGSAAEIIGRKASRSLRAHQPVYPRQIIVPPAVASGDHVQIVAQRRTVSISSAGIALEDGHVGDQIRVRNAASERLLNLWVWEHGVVGTQPQKNLRGG